MAVFMPGASAVRRVLALYMFLVTAHEWEENRFPGDFSAWMKKFTGMNPSVQAEELSYVPVAILLIVILFVPFIFDSMVFLALFPVCLGIFECFVHVMGIFLHKKALYAGNNHGAVYALCVRWHDPVFFRQRYDNGERLSPGRALHGCMFCGHAEPGPRHKRHGL